jgi:hypothetical protein
MKYIFVVFMGLSLLGSFSVEASDNKPTKKHVPSGIEQGIRNVQDYISLRLQLDKELAEGPENPLVKYISPSPIWDTDKDCVLTLWARDHLGYAPHKKVYNYIKIDVATERARMQREADAKKKQEKEAAEHQAQLEALRNKRHQAALGTANPTANQSGEQAIKASKDVGMLDWIDYLMR